MLFLFLCKFTIYPFSTSSVLILFSFLFFALSVSEFEVFVRNSGLYEAERACAPAFCHSSNDSESRIRKFLRI